MPMGWIKWFHGAIYQSNGSILKTINGCYVTIIWIRIQIIISKWVAVVAVIRICVSVGFQIWRIPIGPTMDMEILPSTQWQSKHHWSCLQKKTIFGDSVGARVRCSYWIFLLFETTMEMDIHDLQFSEDQGCQQMMIPPVAGHRDVAFDSHERFTMAL